MSFELPKLTYDYNALEPHIDARTMEIHHSKHHQGYTNNLNNAIAGTDMEGKSIEDICATPGLSGAVRNNGGGYYNHCLFWNIMSPNGGGNPTGELANAIDSKCNTNIYEANMDITDFARAFIYGAEEPFAPGHKINHILQRKNRQPNQKESH